MQHTEMQDNKAVPSIVPSVVPSVVPFSDSTDLFMFGFTPTEEDVTAAIAAGNIEMVAHLRQSVLSLYLEDGQDAAVRQSMGWGKRPWTVATESALRTGSMDMLHFLEKSGCVVRDEDDPILFLCRLRRGECPEDYFTSNLLSLLHTKFGFDLTARHSAAAVDARSSFLLGTLLNVGCPIDAPTCLSQIRCEIDNYQWMERQIRGHISHGTPQSKYPYLPIIEDGTEATDGVEGGTMECNAMNGAIDDTEDGSAVVEYGSDIDTDIDEDMASTNVLWSIKEEEDDDDDPELMHDRI